MVAISAMSGCTRDYIHPSLFTLHVWCAGRGAWRGVVWHVVAAARCILPVRWSTGWWLVAGGWGLGLCGALRAARPRDRLQTTLCFNFNFNLQTSTLGSTLYWMLPRMRDGLMVSSRAAFRPFRGTEE